MKNNFPKYTSVPLTGRVKAVWEFLISKDLNDKTLVDIGCSYGWLEWQLREKRLKKIYALDPYKKAVEYARKNTKGPIYFVSPADKLPVKDSTADIAIMFDVIEHVPVGGELTALKEAFRVLKKGGVFLLTTPYNHLLSNITDPAWYLGHRHYSTKEIVRLAKKAGFEVEATFVKGNLWTIIYMTWFYISKWIFRLKIPRSTFLEAKDNQAYSSEKGIYTLFLEARKP